MGSHVPCALVLLSLSENFLRWNLIVVVISLKPGRHTEVIHKERVLIDVLEQTEFSLCQWEFKPIFEVFMRIQHFRLIIFFVWNRVCWHMDPRLNRLLDVWPMEMCQIFVLPVQLIERKVFYTLRMIQLITQCWQHPSTLKSRVILPILGVFITVRTWRHWLVTVPILLVLT